MISYLTYGLSIGFRACIFAAAFWYLCLILGTQQPEYITTLLLAAVGSFVLDQPIGQAWDRLSPINRPTHIEGALVMGLSVGAGYTGARIVLEPSGWAQTITLLPLIALAVIPVVIAVYTILKIEYSGEDLASSETDSEAATPGTQASVLNDPAALRSAALVFALSLMTLVFGIGFLLGGLDLALSLGQASVVGSLIVFFLFWITGAGIPIAGQTVLKWVGVTPPAQSFNARWLFYFSGLSAISLAMGLIMSLVELFVLSPDQSGSGLFFRWVISIVFGGFIFALAGFTYARVSDRDHVDIDGVF